MKELEQKAMIGFVATAAIYALGVTEAFLSMPKPTKKRKKRRRRNSFRGFGYHLDLLNDPDVEFKNLYNGNVLAMDKKS